MEIIMVTIYMIHWYSLNQLINCRQNIKTIKQSLFVVVTILSFDWKTHREYRLCNSYTTFMTPDLLVSKFLSNTSCENPYS